MRLLCFALLCIATPIFADDDVAAEQVSKDFTLAAKKAIPAVVSIKTSFKPDDRGDPRRELFDFFQDDFLQRFFGGPREGFSLPEQEMPARVGQGSGFLISSDGYIVTNNHVVDDADEISVKLNDGREFDAEIVGKDPQTDLAVIKIDGKNLPFLILGDSNDLEPGQWAIAIGNPLGLQASLTVGVVSATGRANLDLAPFEDFIQTDAAINRGNSGGPLLNIKGEVIGINTAIASNTGGCMGIGFAIPSNMVKSIKDQLLDKGAVTRGFIGVSLQPIDSDLAQAFKLDQVEGALVADVSADSPAKAAGLQRGDVILEYNKKRIPSIGQFRNAIALIPPGTDLTLLIKRDDALLEIPVKIGSHPENGGTPKVKEEEIGNSLGITVEALTPEMADSLGISGEKGVVISKVDPKGQAALVGIKKGALVLSVNKKKVSTPDEFNRALKQEEGQRGVLLFIKQNGQMRYLFLKNSK